MLPVKMWPSPPSPHRLYTLMSSAEGMPRALMSVGDQLDNLSVIAAFRKRFGAVLPLKGKCKGWARGEGSDVSEGTRGVEVMV